MYIIKGQPIPKKNSQEIHYIRRNGKLSPIIAQNKRYVSYEEEALWQLATQRQPVPEPPYNVKCVYYRADNRICDLPNLLEATDDILVKAGIIQDDNFKIVRTHDGSTVYVDPAYPRVEIEITHKGE